MPVKANKTKSTKSPSKGSRSAKVPLAQSRVVHQNSAKFSSSRDGGITVTNSEMISLVNCEVAFTVVPFSINPGIDRSFPWLSGIATRYEKYRFRKLIFEYVSRCSANDRGSIYMAIDQDAVDAAPASSTQLCAYHHSTSSPVWAGDKMVFNQREVLYTRYGAVTGTDLKTYDCGNFFFCSEGAPTVPYSCGQIWVHYVVDFLIPQLESGEQQLTATRLDENLTGTYSWRNVLDPMAEALTNMAINKTMDYANSHATGLAAIAGQAILDTIGTQETVALKLPHDMAGIVTLGIRTLIKHTGTMSTPVYCYPKGQCTTAMGGGGPYYKWANSSVQARCMNNSLVDFTVDTARSKNVKIGNLTGNLQLPTYDGYDFQNTTSTTGTDKIIYTIRYGDQYPYGAPVSGGVLTGYYIDAERLDTTTYQVTHTISSDKIWDAMASVGDIFYVLVESYRTFTIEGLKDGYLTLQTSISDVFRAADGWTTALVADIQAVQGDLPAAAYNAFAAGVFLFNYCPKYKGDELAFGLGSESYWNPTLKSSTSDFYLPGSAPSPHLFKENCTLETPVHRETSETDHLKDRSDDCKPSALRTPTYIASDRGVRDGERSPLRSQPLR